MNKPMHKCTIYGLHGEGSRTVVSIPQIDVDIALTTEKVKMRKERPSLHDKIFLGNKQALK